MSNTMIGAFLAGCVCFALAMMLYRPSWLESAPLAPIPLPTPTLSRPTSTPAPTRGAIGTTGRLPAIGGGYNYSLVWVEETGLWAWNRAYQNRDDKGMSRVMETYETLKIPETTTVRVVDRRGEYMQVEALDGTMSGRRGWIEVTSLIGT